MIIHESIMFMSMVSSILFIIRGFDVILSDYRLIRRGLHFAPLLPVNNIEAVWPSSLLVTYLQKRGSVVVKRLTFKWIVELQDIHMV